MKKLKLKLTQGEMLWLSSFIQHIVQLTPLEDLELESLVITELYARQMSKLTFANKGTLSLKLTEALALKRCFLGMDLQDTYDDTIRNYLFDKINRQCLLT